MSTYDHDHDGLVEAAQRVRQPTPAEREEIVQMLHAWVDANVGGIEGNIFVHMEQGVKAPHIRYSGTYLEREPDGTVSIAVVVVPNE